MLTANDNSITNPWVALAICAGGSVALFLVWRHYWTLMDSINSMYGWKPLSDPSAGWRHKVLAVARPVWLLASVALALVTILLIVVMATNGAQPLSK